MSDYNNQRGGYSNGRGGYGRGGYNGGYGRNDYSGGRGAGLTYAERQALRRVTLQQEVERTLMLQRVLANGAQDPATIMTLMGAMNGGAGGANEALMMATMLQGQHQAVGAAHGQGSVQQVADSVRDLTSVVANLRAEVAALRNGQVELSPLSGRQLQMHPVPNFAPVPARVPAPQQIPVQQPVGNQHAVNPGNQAQAPRANAYGGDEEATIPPPVDPNLKLLVQDALDAAGNPPSSVEMFKKVSSWGLDDVKAVFNHYLPEEPYSNKGQGVFQLVEFLMRHLNAVGHGMGLW